MTQGNSKPPAPVEVTNTDPMPVTLERAVDTSAQTAAKTAAASAQVDANILRTEDQRRISGIWERTQQVIALSVVLPTVVTACFLSFVAAINSDGTIRALGLTAFTLLATLTGSVIGFYFGRTNHQRVGGDTSGIEQDRGR